LPFLLLFVCYVPPCFAIYLDFEGKNGHQVTPLKMELEGPILHRVIVFLLIGKQEM